MPPLFPRLTSIIVATLHVTLADTPPPLFTSIPPAQSGLDYTHKFKPDHRHAYLYYSGAAMGGIYLGDVNGDDLQDIYITGAAGDNALWINQGQLKFKRANIPSLNAKQNWGLGAALVDIDNDGDLDIYQCNYDSPNELFLNDGKGNFTPQPGAFGLDVQDCSMQPSFADVDGDGDLDMFLVCNVLMHPNGRPSTPPITKRNGIPEILPEFSRYFEVRLNHKGNYGLDNYGRRDYLFINSRKDGDEKPRYIDVSSQSGVNMKGYGLSNLWWDYDSDGDLDLYVANDFDEPDRLFRNDGTDANGIPKFTNVIESVFPHISWSSMGSDLVDINRDGLPDLFSVDMSATTHLKAKSSMGALSDARRHLFTHGSPRQAMRNHLLINTGMGRFQETAYAAGISSSDWSWTPKFGDLDNDGYQDLFISNGMLRNLNDADRSISTGDLNKARIGKTMWEIEKNAPPMPEKNIVYQNGGKGKFKARPDWGLGLLGMSYSTAMGDLDNDGDLDLVVSDLTKKTKLYRNNHSGNHSLRISLRSQKGSIIGTRVTAYDNSGTSHTRWHNPHTGYLSQHDSRLHFGFGKKTPRSIEILWPSGTRQLLEVKPNTRSLEINEPSQSNLAPPKPARPIFQRAKSPDFIHKERIYDDFKDQPLIPAKLSQLGPCLAAADVDGDGDTDFYVGGAARQPGALFLNDNGTFTQCPQDAFTSFARYAEDLAAIWFDAEGDGDLDLLVVTGSSEYKPDNILHRDRLYLNHIVDGKPRLTAADDGAFPSLLDNGSCVSAADYDGDGDLDLFIGTRSISGKYPLPATSRLIRNDSTAQAVKFTDATPDSFKNLGLVTDAVWADLNNDKTPDLAITCDWGPVRVFLNKKGNLTEKTQSSGLSQKIGWWSSLHAADIDGDGDLDLIAGNTGINTKYKKPSSKKPAILYYGDMDGSGKPRIVEAKKERDRPLPVRGRF